MKYLFFVTVLFYSTIALYGQQQSPDKERMIEALKQSGYLRQEGNTLIYKVKKASDTAQAKLVYGALFNNTAYTVRFEIDGKYFYNPKIKPVVKPAEKKEETVITEAVVTKTLTKTPLATAAQLYLSGGKFLIKSARDYRYITYLNPGDRNGRLPVVWSYINNPVQQNWRFILQAEGYFRIQSESGLFLMAVKTPEKNYVTVLREPANGDAFLWRLIPLGNGIFNIINKEGGYIEFKSRKADGEPVVNDSVADGSINQKWHLIRLDGEHPVMTNFIPATHGFHFTNSFTNSRFLAGGTEISMGGRCAGMVWAALDYFNARSSIPAINTLPSEGSVLSTYIGARQEQSTNANIDEFIEVGANFFGWRTTEFFNWGLQGFNNGKLQQIKNAIDAGRPVALMLVNPSNLITHHSVLAIGYSMGRYTGDLNNFKEDYKLYIYDPNFPDQVKILIPNMADMSNPRYAYVNASVTDNDVNEWLTYFPSDGYRAQTPLSSTEVSGCPAVTRQISGQNFRGTNHSNQNFKCAVANRTDFYGATFMQVDFENAKLDSAIFYGANVRNSNYSNTSLTGTNFYGADLKDTRFLFARADKALFEGADMKLAKFNSGNFINSSFRGADMHRTNFAGTNFTGSHFTRASLSNSAGENANFSNTELSSANFQNAYLKGAVFRNAILEGTDFRNADLTNADFTGVIIRIRPLLEGAKMEGVIGLTR